MADELTVPRRGELSLCRFTPSPPLLSPHPVAQTAELLAAGSKPGTPNFLTPNKERLPALQALLVNVLDHVLFREVHPAAL